MNTENKKTYEQKLLESIYLVCKKHPQLVNFTFNKTKTRLSDQPQNILREAFAFSSGEYVLVQVMLDLWSGSGHVNLYDIVSTLDDENFKNVIMALLHLRNI